LTNKLIKFIFVLKQSNKAELKKRGKKMLVIFNNQEGSFNAVSTKSDDQMHGLQGSLFDMWSEASQLLKVGDEQPVFRFHELKFETEEFTASWDDYANGYEIVFKDGHSAITQCYRNENKLHAEYGCDFIEVNGYAENTLNIDQEAILDDLMENINKISFNFGAQAPQQR
jgi:hypothetical protein